MVCTTYRFLQSKLPVLSQWNMRIQCCKFQWTQLKWTVSSSKAMDNPRDVAQSSSTPAKLDSGDSARSTNKGDGVRKRISVKQYNSSKSHDRPWSSRRSSRSPNRCQPWSHAPPRGPSEHSSRRDRRQESPPRRLVLTGSDLQDFLTYQKKMMKN